MARDQCVDCEAHIEPCDAAAFGGRCSPCHLLYLGRQPKPKKGKADVEEEEED